VSDGRVRARLVSGVFEVTLPLKEIRQMSDLTECPHCGVRVILTSDGQCPACRKPHVPPGDYAPESSQRVDGVQANNRAPGTSKFIRLAIIGLLCIGSIAALYWYDKVYKPTQPWLRSTAEGDKNAHVKWDQQTACFVDSESRFYVICRRSSAENSECTPLVVREDGIVIPTSILPEYYRGHYAEIVFRQDREFSHALSLDEVERISLKRIDKAIADSRNRDHVSHLHRLRQATQSFYTNERELAESSLKFLEQARTKSPTSSTLPLLSGKIDRLLKYLGRDPHIESADLPGIPNSSRPILEDAHKRAVEKFKRTLERAPQQDTSNPLESDPLEGIKLTPESEKARKRALERTPESEKG
jgi:hypothetical protein